MFHSAVRFLDYVFGPSVTRVHKSTDGLNRAYDYYPNDIEELSQKVLAVAYVFKISVIYSSPFWLIYFYHKGNCNIPFSLGFKFLTWSSCLFGTAYFLRGFGRSNNSEYVLFMESLRKCIEDPENRVKKKHLRRYDFDFDEWPVDYISENVDGHSGRDSVISLQRSSFKSKYELVVDGFLKETLAFVLSEHVGLRLMFPGSIGLLKWICSPSMQIHRNRLIEEHDGIRAKLCAEDGNMIDTMFIDRRLRGTTQGLESSDGRVVPNKHGNTLIICCEGNAGFYECGCMSTPMQCGYSVLGWNHPGYMCSTGSPSPASDVLALDVVVEYAIYHLQFPPRNIIIFAWALGCYSAIEVAARYPNIKGLILDSSFDDALVIAKHLLPSFAESFVTYIIRTHLNMNNMENLRRYDGPVSFIRREKDEVMNLDGPHVPGSNVGNRLLEDFLKTRFPKLFDEEASVSGEEANVPDEGGNVSGVGSCPQEKLLRKWLRLPDQTHRDALLTEWGAYSSDNINILVEELDYEREKTFPMRIGSDLSSVQRSQLILFLANKYMHNFAASHCQALHPSLLLPPWSIEFLKEPDPVSSDIESEYEVVHSSALLIGPIKYSAIQ